MRFTVFTLVLAGSFLPVRAFAQEKADKPVLVLDTGGHTAIVSKVHFTPDGKQLLTISRDKSIRIWDVKSGETMRVLRPPIGPGREGTLLASALSPDGQTLAVAGLGFRGDKGPNIYLIALASGQMERILTGHEDLIGVMAFSPDGRRLLSSSNDKTARVWNVGTGECEHTLRVNATVIGVTFSPDGRQAGTASFDRLARLWDVSTGKCLATLQGHDKEVLHIAWSPDGRTIATGSSDQSIRLWERDGSFRKSFDKLGGGIGPLTFSPDSSELLFTRHGPSYVCSLLNIRSGQERLRFEQHNNAVQHGTLSPDGKLAATTGGNDHEIFVWQTTDGQVLHQLRGKGRRCYSAGWSKAESAIAWGNTFNTKLPLERSFRLASLEWGESPDTSYSQGQMRLGSLSLERIDRNTVAVKQDNTPRAEIMVAGDAVLCFTLLAGDRAAIGTYFGLHLFDALTGKRIRSFSGHTDSVWGVAPSPDNRYLLSASGDQTVRVWDPDRAEPLLSLFFAGQDWIAWTPEGFYAASPDGEKLMGWTINNGPAKMATFYPAAQFRKTLYRPDVIKRLLEAGSVDKALTLADKERGHSTVRTEVAQQLPPKVRLLSPDRSGQKPTAPELTVKAEADDPTHPIASLQLLLDGRPLQTRLFQPPRLGRVTATWEIDVPAGSHRLAVKAANDVSQAVSDEVEVTYAPAGSPAVAPKGTLHLVAIGINDYPGRLKLDAAAPDAQALTRAFQQFSRPLFQQVKDQQLLNGQATRANILIALEKVQQQARPGDLVVVFYAGHGDSQRTGELHLVPVDADLKNLAATGVSGETLKTKLGNLPCTTLVILDACYSGSFSEGKKKRALPTGADNLVREFIYDAGLVVMCGAAKEQEAAEEKGQGYFTRALVEGLSGKAPKDAAGVINLSALQYYVEERVKKLSDGDQEPTIHRPSTVRNFALARP